jgi:cytochrome o ubiquinol oxidase subunit 2
MFVRVLQKSLVLLLTSATLAGCNAVVLHPAGDVALQQRNLVVVSTLMMLLIILPVMALTLIFAWRYRHSNTKAVYKPDWHHSTQLELVIWSAPLLIIIALGALTWVGTHMLDPYRPIDRLEAGRAVPKGTKPLNVQVVALDWKWLFIYPDYGIATVNELAAPIDVPINFKITSSTVMNSFFVPALAGQIYAMPAMETQLHAVINRTGEYEGFSANYSGAGFSDMRFAFHGMSAADFERWVAAIKAGGGTLEREDYLKLDRPSVRDPVQHYASVAANLYDAILNLCVDKTKMCVHDMMAIDARGGLGLAAAYNISRLSYDLPRTRSDAPAPRREYVTALCAADPDPIAGSTSRPLVSSALASPLPNGASVRFAP